MSVILVPVIAIVMADSNDEFSSQFPFVILGPYANGTSINITFHFWT